MSGFSNGDENYWDGHDRIAALVAFCTVCVLIFSNQGDRHLWQDESGDRFLLLATFFKRGSRSHGTESDL